MASFWRAWQFALSVLALGACVASTPDVDPATPAAPPRSASAIAPVPSATAPTPCPTFTVPGHPPIPAPCPIQVPPEVWQCLFESIKRQTPPLDPSAIPNIPGLPLGRQRAARPPAGPFGEVFVTVERREGSITHGWLLRVRQELRLAFLSCYRPELQANASAEGVVALSLEIAGPKQLALSSPALAGTLSSRLVDCATAEIQRTELEAAGGGIIKVDLRIRFMPPGRVP